MGSRPWLRRASATLTAVAVFGLGAGSAQAVDEEPPPSPFAVSIVSPVLHAPAMGGYVEIVFRVTSDGVHTPATADVMLSSGSYTDERGHRMTATVALPPECAVECVQTVTLDTATWHHPGDDPTAPDPTLNERVDQILTVEVRSADAGATPATARLCRPS